MRAAGEVLLPLVLRRLDRPGVRQIRDAVARQIRVVRQSQAVLRGRLGLRVRQYPSGCVSDALDGVLRQTGPEWKDRCPASAAGSCQDRWLDGDRKSASRAGFLRPGQGFPYLVLPAAELGPCKQAGGRFVASPCAVREVRVAPEAWQRPVPEMKWILLRC